ncbi:unnamed protein product [Mytilus coruscus]|uniref:Uncharacterized protein n=1 Tax=Mytilus coruscus TaxID=42192 RepID=A0A6J8A810_MYTCO|nr:unnamed protein product [Mytilus coruscus]
MSRSLRWMDHPLHDLSKSTKEWQRELTSSKAERSGTSLTSMFQPDMFSSQTTVASNWSKDERSQKDTFNWAMEVMSHGQYSPLKSQASLNLEDLQHSTKMYYIRQARLTFEIVCESIAPSQGLTIYKIDAARKYASTHGPGQYVSPPKITHLRLSKQKIHYFIEFISAPCYLQVVGFGSRHLKLSSGLAVKVPKAIRTMIASRLITAYNNCCKDNSILPPCRATQYKTIKACAASQLKSLHGLDNYISDGMESIDTLKKVVSNLGTKGLQTSKVPYSKFRHLEITSEE